MTCDEEAIKRQSQPKFYCSLDAWKQNSEASKKLHNSVRPLIIQEERGEMAKNHRRYIEEEMKKFAEQQAKHRDAPSAVSQVGIMPQQRMGQAHFAPAPGSAYSLMQVPPMNAPGRPVNPRKRTYEEGAPGWMQHSVPTNRTINGIPTQLNSTTRNLQFSQQMELMPSSQNKARIRPQSSVECAIPNLRHQNVTMQLNKTSNSPVCQLPIPSSSESHCNGSSIGDFGDTTMRNFMDQIKPGNTLNDLGDGCLDDVLNGPGDCLQQPSTSAAASFDEKLESPANRTVASINSNSIISPGSLTARSLIDGPSSNSISRNNSLSSEKTDSGASRKPTPDTSAYGNPLGNPLSSSTPSSSSPSSCCFSQTPSTSGFPPTGIPRTSMHVGSGGSLQMCNQPYPEQLNPFTSNNDSRLIQQSNSHSYGIVSQPYQYLKESSVETLIRTQQRFMNPLEAKRQQLANHEYPPASIPSHPIPTYEEQAKAMEASRMAAACNQRPTVSVQYQSAAMAAGQAQQMTTAQGRMFPDQYMMHSTMQRPQNEIYPNYQIAPTRQQQMAMYQANGGQMSMSNQQFHNGYMPSSQPYFSPANVSYRYP